MVLSAVSSAVNTIGGLLATEVASLWGVNDQIKDLHTELIWMQCFLKRAAARKLDDDVVRTHVAEIRELAYDAEDVIETFALKVASRRKGGFSKVIKRSACILKEGWLLCQTKCKIEKITARITKLTRRLKTYKLDDDKSRDEASSSNQMQQLRRPYPHIPDDNVVGLADDIKRLVSVLVDEKSDCRVASIWGMGGLGKTTLAKEIYHHSGVIGHFNHMSFVYVSQQCQQRKVWEDILSGLKMLEKEDRKRSDQEVAEKLYGVLKNKKCLVILDDIWSTEDWGLLKPAFPVERETKSKFLLTSRRKEVVSQADISGYLHGLQLLEEKQSWELFQKIAFPQTGSTFDARMEELGKSMIRHCAGLPLAITVVGGILATKTTVYEWQMVLENFNSYLKKRGKGLSTMDVLALSFDDLPPYLRPCFLYLSVFPEDYEICAERLIQLWIAEGFVLSEEEDKGEVMEDVAERWLVELVERCMLQVVERSPDLSKIVTCRMHDLMRELCVSMARKEGFVRIVDDPSFPPPNNRAVRRVVSHQLNLFRTIKSYPLRSLLFFNNQFEFNTLLEAFLNPKALKYCEEVANVKSCLLWVALVFFTMWKAQGCWRYLFSNFKLLRVLDFEQCYADGGCRLPSAIGNLIQLRFLKFGEFDFVCSRIPSSLGNLSCLQSLDLEDFGRLGIIIYVPDVIWKLEELRHLYLPKEMDDKTKLKLHTLRKLQTLFNFDTRNCFAADLSKLTNLRKLKILGPLDMENFKVGLDKNQPIITSKYLQSLSIGSDRIDPEVLGHLVPSCVNLCELMVLGNLKKVPAYHHFPSTTAYVRFEGYFLVEDLMPTLGKLSNLRVLELVSKIGSLRRHKIVSSAPHFPRLQSLTLSNLWGLEEWKVEEGAMPALRHLKINVCLDLKMLPDGLRFITTLQELKIEGMPKEFKDKMVQGGQDFYKIQHVPSVIFSNIFEPFGTSFLS